MNSELKKLWNKRNELNKKVDYGVCRATLVDKILLGHNRKQIQRIDKQINTFNLKKDEYNWGEYFRSMVKK